jgi:hypothetical protein
VIAIPLAGVFLAGLVLGSAVNWAIYSLAWFARPISPWALPHADAQPRSWRDRLPLLGWFGLRREAALHGSLFWCDRSMNWLYWQDFTTEVVARPDPMGRAPSAVTLHAPPQFLALRSLLPS